MMTLIRGRCMIRREFIRLLSGAAVAWPAPVLAQKSATPVVGYLSSKGEASEQDILSGIRKGLAQQGLAEGRDLSFEFGWSGGDYDRLPKLAASLVAHNVDVIMTSGLPATLAAKAVTSKIPIVFRLGVDPVQFKLAASFDRPGGNLTGVTMMFDALTPKKLQLLHELVADASIGLLVNPKNPNAASHKEHAETAAKALGIRLTFLSAAGVSEFGAAFERGRNAKLGAILVGDDPLFDNEGQRLVEAANRSKIPTMYHVRNFVVSGGLLSYGPSFEEMSTQAGIYIGRALKGEKPAVLPIVQPTKFELVINRKTAKAIGIEIPSKLLFTADEVIE